MYLATLEIENRRCSISSCVPIVTTIIRHLEGHVNRPQIQLNEFRKAVCEGLKFRMAKAGSLLEHTAAEFATLSSNGNQSSDHLESRIRLGGIFALMEAQENDQNAFIQPISDVNPSASLNLYTKTQAIVQVAEYLAEKPIPFSSDPFLYWKLKEEHGKLPLLCRVARKFLSAPSDQQRAYDDVAAAVRTQRQSHHQQQHFGWLSKDLSNANAMVNGRSQFKAQHDDGTCKKNKRQQWNVYDKKAHNHAKIIPLGKNNAQKSEAATAASGSISGKLPAEKRQNAATAEIETTPATSFCCCSSAAAGGAKIQIQNSTEPTPPLPPAAKLFELAQCEQEMRQIATKCNLHFSEKRGSYLFMPPRDTKAFKDGVLLSLTDRGDHIRMDEFHSARSQVDKIQRWPKAHGHANVMRLASDQCARLLFANSS
ncbi:hypothetical protein niasHS_013850 [Heterodera schachtii]|uniref:Uncharacterized protein n=1 Tax=Heterodera schachtii TaxID=97005 RepID=A0ABD2J3E0_HETSC